MGLYYFHDSLLQLTFDYPKIYQSQNLLLYSQQHQKGIGEKINWRNLLPYKDRHKMKILSNLEKKFLSYIISVLSDVNGETRGCQQCIFCDRVCLRTSLSLKLCDVGPGNMNSGKNKSLQGLGNQDIRANVRVSGRICGLVRTQGENPQALHCGCWLSAAGQLCRTFGECSHGYLLP